MNQRKDANRHAREHAECSKSEVLDILRSHGRQMVEFAGGLEDSELDRIGYLPALGASITVEQFLESAVLESANEHFQSMMTATGK